MKYLISLLFLLSGCYRLQAQHITAGPVSGGVTDSSFRVYIQTAPDPQKLVWQLATDSAFTKIVQSGTDSTRTVLYGGGTFTFTGLQPATRYYYRFLFNNQPDARQGRVKTFPKSGSKGYYKIAVGSCGYFPNDPLYQLIQNFQPDVFIHLGDWHWPPAQFGNDMCLHPDRRAASFAERYTDGSMQKLILPYFPIDYVYDDDYSWNDSEGWTYPTFTVSSSGGMAVNNLYTTPMPPGIREGAIQGYFDHFPAYPAVDTGAGIHHSFRLGNAEFFMLDTRNSRTARHEAFVKDAAGKYTYQPPAGHTMLGQSQREWLINGLKNSTADWKFIGSSVIFNKNYKIILDFGLQIQGLALTVNGSLWSGAVIASQMSYNWAGYPTDHDSILNLAQRGDIRNVVVLSGDSHSNMIDDGTNAGLPELSASGLSSNDEGTVNMQINQLAGFFGYPSAENLLWNGGGNGLGNQAANARDGFGTVEIFGADSIRLCVFDELGVKLGCKTILAKNTVSTTPLPDLADYQLSPNPAENNLFIRSTSRIEWLEIWDLVGKHYALPLMQSATIAQADVSVLQPGIYFVQPFTAEGQKGMVKKFIKL